MKRITLEIRYADKKTELRQLENGTYVIGRENVDISLNNTIVSGRHGELNVNDASIIYTDQGSTNGTLLADGTKLDGPYTMTEGTILNIGECQVTLKSIHKPQAATVMQPAVKKQDISNMKTMLGTPAVTLPPTNTPSTPAPAATPAPAPAADTGAAQSASTAPVSEPEPAADSSALATSTPDNQDNNNDDTATTGIDYKLDIAEMVKAPMDDSGWLVKCLIMGLITLIPILGGINLAGWMVAIYRNRKNGSSDLPPANLSYIGDGITILLAYLPAVGAVIGVNIVLTILTTILPFLALVFALLSGLFYLAASIYFICAGPAILYLTLEHDLKWASMQWREILRFAQNNKPVYINLIIAFLIAGVVGGLGSIIFIGALLTIPYSAAIQGKILADIK